MKFRTLYDEDYDPEEFATVVEGESATKQSFKDECDINNIMAKFEKTGVLEHVNNWEAEYGFIDGATFQDYQLQVAKAKTMFEELPAKTRERFGNDPAKFLDYFDGEKKPDIEELLELELVDPMSVRRSQQEGDPPPPPAEPESAEEA